jgi:hypothetical protein
VSQRGEGLRFHRVRGTKEGHSCLRAPVVPYQTQTQTDNIPLTFMRSLFPRRQFGNIFPHAKCYVKNRTDPHEESNQRGVTVSKCLIKRGYIQYSTPSTQTDIVTWGPLHFLLSWCDVFNPHWSVKGAICSYCLHFWTNK